jgi:hypothetical protein
MSNPEYKTLTKEILMDFIESISKNVFSKFDFINVVPEVKHRFDYTDVEERRKELLETLPDCGYQIGPLYTGKLGVIEFMLAFEKEAILTINQESKTI